MRRLEILRTAALANGHRAYHLIATARVGKSIVWATNTRECCAERVLLKKLRGIHVDRVEVMRFRRSGGVGMARPCSRCQVALIAAGVKWVSYTTSDGGTKLERMK